MICEKCWKDAQLRSALSGKPVVEEYLKLLEERKDHPCSLEEQRGISYETE